MNEIKTKRFSMIYYHSAYSTTKNIGEYYNAALSLLPAATDHACFVDGDAMFTTSDYGHQIQAAIEANAEARLFYACTNRIRCPWQIAPGAPTGDDVRVHRGFGLRLQHARGAAVRQVQNEVVPGSGFFLLIRKDLWQSIGLFHQGGMLGVDWQYFVRVKRAGEPILQMTGVYLYHWYRGGAGGTSHLQ